MATLAFATIQDIKYTETQLGMGVTIEYTTGATAGSEVVTVSGHAISIQIETTVSTAAQILAAFNAHRASATYRAASELATALITGTPSNTQTAPVAPTALTGAVGDGALAFFRNQAITALTGSFVRFRFGFMSDELTLVNDETAGTNRVQFSFDGVNTHGDLSFGQSINWPNADRTEIWLKFVTAAPAYRLMVSGH